jgi:hypothetical protein
MLVGGQFALEEQGLAREGMQLPALWSDPAPRVVRNPGPELVSGCGARSPRADLVGQRAAHKTEHGLVVAVRPIRRVVVVEKPLDEQLHLLDQWRPFLDEQHVRINGPDDLRQPAAEVLDVGDPFEPDRSSRGARERLRNSRIGEPIGVPGSPEQREHPLAVERGDLQFLHVGPPGRLQCLAPHCASPRRPVPHRPSGRYNVRPSPVSGLNPKRS